MSRLASRICSSATSPAHCKAKAAHEPTRPPPPMIVTFMPDPSRLFQLRHDLVSDGLNRRFRIAVVRSRRFRFRRNRTCHARTPLVVVAKFAFLKAVARIRDTEALLDLQQILKLPRCECVWCFAQ